MEKIKACKQKLSELKKYENIIKKKKHVKKLIFFFKFKKKSETLRQKGAYKIGKITKYWLILFKIEVKKIILFVPMTGKKLINGHILKNSFL